MAKRTQLTAAAEVGHLSCRGSAGLHEPNVGPVHRGAAALRHRSQHAARFEARASASAVFGRFMLTGQTGGTEDCSGEVCGSLFILLPWMEVEVEVTDTFMPFSI